VAPNVCLQTGLNNGGLELDMPTGRLDGLVSSAAEATALIVSPKSTAQQLIQQFEQRGFSQDEMITLSGSECNSWSVVAVRSYIAAKQLAALKSLRSPKENKLSIYMHGHVSKISLWISRGLHSVVWGHGNAGSSYPSFEARKQQNTPIWPAAILLLKNLT
jgi:hypothetical protein